MNTLFGMIMTVIFDAVSIGRNQIETASKRSGDADRQGIVGCLKRKMGETAGKIGKTANG